jgi:hypothetical protein
LVSVRWRDVFGVLWRPLFAGVAMYFAVQDYLQLSGNPRDLAHLLLSVALGAGVYALLICLAWRLFGCPDGAERFLFSRIRQRFS